LAVLQKISLYANERWDTPDARFLDAASLNDWRFFLSGAMSDRSLVLAGFDITNYTTVFTVSGFKLKLSDAVIFHTEATTQAAGFYSAAGTEPDASVTLAPSSTNFVEVDLTVESDTPDVRAFWDPGANSGAGGEFTDSVDTVINLVISVTSNVTGFTAGKIPLYKVITDSSGVATSVTDVRPLFFRLGTGGQTPNPNYNFDFPDLPDAAHERLETPITATSATASNAPFQGGDKNLRNFKDWMDAVMTSIKEVKGSPYWYSSSGALSIPAAYQNAALTVLVGGTWEHVTASLGHLKLISGTTAFRLGLANNLSLSAFTDIDLTPAAQRVLFLITPSSDLAVTYGFGQNGTSPVTPKAVTAVTATSITVSTVAPAGNYVTGAGKILVRGVEFSYTSHTAGTGLFSGVAPDPSGIVTIGDDVYQLNSGAVGYYHYSATSAVPGLSGTVTEGAERTIWLAIYDGSSVIQMKNGDLEQGEQIQVGDNTSIQVLSYIGTPGEATSAPTYVTTATGAKTGQTDYNSTVGDNLTIRASRLTTMVADKAQDKTIKLQHFDAEQVVNTTNGGDQDITFVGGTPELRVLMPSSTSNGAIGLGMTLSLGTNEVAYFSVDRNAALSIADLSGLTVSSFSAVPLNENVYIFAYRLTDTAVHLWSGRRFEVGTFDLNQEFSSDVIDRLGITDEAVYQAYGSTVLITPSDNYATAISVLDAAVSSILAATTEEEFGIVGFGGTTTFTVTTFSFDPSNTTPDINVYVNGRHQTLDPTGGLLQDYRKTSATAIEFSYTVPENARITVRKEGNNSGLGLISQHLIPSLHNTFDIGSPGFHFRDGYFAGKLTVIGGIDPAYIQLTPQASAAGVPNNSLWIDANDSNSVKVKRPSGSDTIGAGSSTNLLVKIMENDDLINPIAAYKPVSKLSSGKIVQADSDAAQGQKYIGITMASIPAGGSGAVLLPGPNLENAVATLGFAPGDEVYLSETGGYTNAPGSFAGDNDSIIKVGIADCAGGSASATATDLVMITEVLIRP
jgi:hypothetical protein